MEFITLVKVYILKLGLILRSQQKYEIALDYYN